MNNKFCDLCPHKDVPQYLKKLFERYAWNNFFNNDCPIDDDKVVGCLRSLEPIDWEQFKEWLINNGIAETST